MTSTNVDLAPAPAEPLPDAGPVIHIRPTRGWGHLDLRELWPYRELLYFLTWRDIKVRYKQSVLGVAWVIIQPVMTTGAFVFLFRLLMGAGNEPTVPGVPYAMSTFCAMLPWHLFASSVNRSSNSLAAEESIFTKVYFPRLLLPLSSVLSGIIDFLIAFALLLVLMPLFGVMPTWRMVAVPVLAGWAVVASLAIGFWLSILSAIYRDVRYALPFAVQFAMYVSPVIYATAVLKDDLPVWAMRIYQLNPMVAVIEGFRWAVLGTADVPARMLLPSVVVTAILFVAGLYFFRRMERTIVDVI